MILIMSCLTNSWTWYMIRIMSCLTNSWTWHMIRIMSCILTNSWTWHMILIMSCLTNSWTWHMILIMWCILTNSWTWHILIMSSIFNKFMNVTYDYLWYSIRNHRFNWLIIWCCRSTKTQKICHLETILTLDAKHGPQIRFFVHKMNLEQCCGWSK